MAGKKNKKTKTNKQKLSKYEPEHLTKAPHSFVFSRGHVGPNVVQLTMDMRKVMEPYTASNLKVTKKNVLKDFVGVAGALGVTNFISFNKTSSGLNMRLARLPKGPTLYFKVKKFCLCKDVTSSLKRPKVAQGQFKGSPLLVLNNFKDEEGAAGIDTINPKKLCATMLQNMFPSISIHKLNLNAVQRSVLFNVDPETGFIEMRHYNIAVKPIGVSRRMKKLVTNKSFPNLGKYKDLGDYLMQSGGSASESEPDLDDGTGNVELPHKMTGQGNLKNEQSAVRLTELGPRLTLELYKVEDDLCKGRILYHKLIEKTEEEIKENEARRDEKLREKQIRKQEQEENIRKKEEKKEINKQKSILGMKRKHQQDEENNADGEEDEDDSTSPAKSAKLNNKKFSKRGPKKIIGSKINKSRKK